MKGGKGSPLSAALVTVDSDMVRRQGLWAEANPGQQPTSDLQAAEKNIDGVTNDSPEMYRSKGKTENGLHDMATGEFRKEVDEMLGFMDTEHMKCSDTGVKKIATGEESIAAGKQHQYKTPSSIISNEESKPG